MASEPSIDLPVPTKQFQLVGGALCLDFCNTMGGKREGIPRDCLNRCADFISWSEQAGLLSGPRSEKLARLAAQNSVEAAAVFKRAIDLREALYRIFRSASAKHTPRKADLIQLNSELARALGRRRVEASETGRGFAWDWKDEEALDASLGPIALSAAELLTTSEQVARVRQCHGENCGWLFLDSSKNHSRCWCDMRDCGNRAKVRRHRLKLSAAKPPPGSEKQPPVDP